MTDVWGPLSPLAGDWEGEGGLDTAYSHASGTVVQTPYLEKLTFKAFGPVQNGRQTLYGLDYRTAMWRDSEDNPFHTEVGYWLWDAEAGEIVRGFVVPRGIVVLAGGAAAAHARSFTLTAKSGAAGYTIGENAYLAANASSVAYTVTVTTHDDGTWSYEEASTLRMNEFPDPFLHSDRNTLHKVG